MKLISRAELMELLNVSVATTDRYEKKGVIPKAIRRPGMQPKWVLEDVLRGLGLENK